MKKNTAAPDSQEGALNILRICTVLLAVVSFWATAQGMADYVFSERWQAYAASLGVQGILLGLNFYLPAFWKQISGKKGFRGAFAFLTLVTLVCSSWFSYIFIVGKVYASSWDTDSRLLVQSTYRKELYKASDYAGEYQDLLRDSLSRQIMDLYGQAAQLKNEDAAASATAKIDWGKERDAYTGEGFAAADEMSIIIASMEAAMAEEATANELDTANNDITIFGSAVEQEIQSLPAQIEDARKAVKQESADVDTARSRRERAIDADEWNRLDAIVKDNEKISEQLKNEYTALITKLEQYQNAKSRISFYSGVLKRIASTTSNRISADLRDIQLELFKEDPVLSVLSGKAEGVFQELQSSTEISVEGSPAYQSLLEGTDRFISELKDYQSVKDAASQLEKLISGLRTEDGVLSGNAGKAEAGAGRWKSRWLQRLDKLKSLTASLPVYHGSENAMLRQYDRAKASDTLDQAIRRYMTSHNAAQQGLIYLSCPYRALAVFSLVLALFLDVSAFITGVLIETVSKQAAVDDAGGESLSLAGLPAPEWNTCPGLSRYLYLNGDYFHENGQNIYTVVENGAEIKAALPDAGLSPGLYVRQQDTVVPVQEQALVLARMSGGPRDGVYQDCFLAYEDHMLTIQCAQDAEPRYLATVDEDLPVFLLTEDACDILPVKCLQWKKWSTAVVALHERGSRVIAVYLT